MWKKLRLVFISLILITLLGLPAYADWVEGDGHKMHFPQLPDEVGWDVACMEPTILADDWRCSQTGVVDDIHFWGSWRDINGDSVGEIGSISAFHIRIFTDIPADQNPDGFSKPGMILRDWTIGISNVTVVSVTPPPQYLEGWLDPTIDPPSNVWYNDHDEYFQYNITGLSDLVMEPFIQDSNTVYWLGISAIVEPVTPQPQWGWKSSTYHFNDDAVVGEPPIYNWQELYEPPRVGNFNVTFSTAGTFQSGNGINYYDDGLSSGGWYFYPNTNWWNIWFYDNPLSLERKKTVRITFTVRRLVPIPLIPGQLTLAVNYSNPEWPPDGPPPLPPLTPADEELYVGRQTLVNMAVWDSPQPVVVTAEIPSFNPEWVSIDVMGNNFIIENGIIIHECLSQQTSEPQSLDLAFVITGFPVVDTGACCYDDPTAPLCVNTNESDCINNLLGTWYPNDDCNDPAFVCPTGPTPGACCYPDQTCLVMTQSDCELVAGGQYMGDGTDCTDSEPNGIADICETQEPEGACCLTDGSCTMMTQTDCEATTGAWYVGDNIHCLGDLNSNGINDICETDTTIKWEQLPDLDPTGMDISAFRHPQYQPYLLADDFQCTQTGPITRIDIWGSWYHDNLPVEPPGFILSFHSDIPADINPHGTYSEPGELLWLDTLYIYDQWIYASGLEEGWFEPPYSYEILGDTVCWQYSFTEFEQPFIQMGTETEPVIYWLDVQVLLPTYETAFFGWKTSLEHWNDDATWIQAVEPIPPDPLVIWNELRYPDLHPLHPWSIDLAFRIYGEEEEPQTGACCHPDQTCLVTTQSACELVAGAQYMGDGTDCTDGDGNSIADICETPEPQGACCLPGGGCATMTQTACEALVGAWYVGDNILCQGDNNSNGINDLCETDTTLKWEQLPDLDPTGMDISAFNHPQYPKYLLADDFECTQTGPITKIDIWGSWWQDRLPMEPPAFVLSFHRDIPASENPYGTYSMPGELLWLDTLYAYDRIMYASGLEEGWFEPPSDYDIIGDTVCWLYSFTAFDEPFIQMGTSDVPVIYWLDVQIILPFYETAFFGWKTSQFHWNDDAAWIQAVEPLPIDPIPQWFELKYPELHPMYPQSIDLAFAIYGEEQELLPDTCTYYKSPYPDYTPNGMPDFDQKQDAWTGMTGSWSYCGPVALANCFWWFDSKYQFEIDPASPPPPAVNDDYALVQSYDPTGLWDDHDINNVMPFVDSLAMYSNCSNMTNGTFIYDLISGANTWINSRGLGAYYSVTPVPIPPFELIRDEVLISQDVILLLGFYELIPTGQCNRLGGHYVTVAGVCEQEWQLCLSDPWYDKNEGEPPAGSAHGSGVHNDAQFVSGPHGTIHHDAYDVVLNIPPVCVPIGGPPPVIELSDYPDSYTDIMNFNFQNQTDPLIDPIPYSGGVIHTFVDYAIIICPVLPEPDINVVPDTVNYERCIETDTVYTAQFQVCNTGTASLTVTGITCDLGFVGVVTAMPIVIPASTCVDIDIRINTTGIPSATYAGDFHVSSDDPDEPVADKPHIRVDVVEQNISVSPDSIYHQQAINTIVDYTSDFAIYNTGLCPLNYTIVYTPTWAALTGATGNIPAAGNDPIDIQINTNSLAVGTYVDSIRITSDDPDTPILYRPKIVLEVTDEPSNFDYLPGDVNMAGGTWPPAATGPDVTYLVNYFRSYATSVPCLMHNPGALVAPPYFWASADANGDCNLIGSDVTKLVNVFRGIGSIMYCSDFPPNYPPIPGTMPAGWPNCATLPLATKTVIPTEPEK